MPSVGKDNMVGAKAKVTVMLEVYLNDTWGDECTVAQINKQARASAIGLLNRAYNGKDVQIVGVPEVTSVLVQDKA